MPASAQQCFKAIFRQSKHTDNYLNRSLLLFFDILPYPVVGYASVQLTRKLTYNESGWG